jgi:pyrroloquinoline quinone (PQQ) biosynthesis protein C
MRMFEPDHLTFEQLSEQLRAYEKKYGYSTIEFYRRFQDGELGDDANMLMWAGLYHLYLTSLPIRQFMQREMARREN